MQFVSARLLLDRTQLKMSIPNKELKKRREKESLTVLILLIYTANKTMTKHITQFYERMMAAIGIFACVCDLLPKNKHNMDHFPHVQHSSVLVEKQTPCHVDTKCVLYATGSTFPFCNCHRHRRL